MKSKLSWKWVIIVSVIFAIFIAFVLPQIDSYSNKITGQTKSPDTSLIYSAEDLYKMAESYGESGRATYIKLRWTFDLVWPIIYTLFLVLWAIKISEYTAKNKASRVLFVIPIIGMIFDFLENLGASILMYRYPLKSGLIANITPIMTLAKWITLSGFLLGTLFLLLFIGISNIRSSKK